MSTQPSKPPRAVTPEIVDYVGSTEVMVVSPDGICRPYHCKGDVEGIWTIGKGHRINEKAEPHLMKGIPRAEAEELYKKDVADHAKWIEHDARVPLNDWQYSALASASFNLGSRWLVSLGPKVRPNDPKNNRVTTLALKLWNRDYIGAFCRLYEFANNTGGVYLDGLFYRRLVETFYAFTGIVVKGVDTCTEARDLMARIGQAAGPSNVVEMKAFFERKHRRDLCNACKKGKGR